MAGEEVGVVDLVRRDKGDGVGQLLLADEGAQRELVGAGVAELIHVVLVDDAVARAVLVGDDDGVDRKALAGELLGKGRVLDGVHDRHGDVVRRQAAVVFQQVFHGLGLRTRLHQRVDVHRLVDGRDHALRLLRDGVEPVAGEVVGKAPDVVQGRDDDVQQDRDDDDRHNKQRGKAAVAQPSGAEQRGLLLLLLVFLLIAHGLNPHSIFSFRSCTPSAAGRPPQS